VQKSFIGEGGFNGGGVAPFGDIPRGENGHEKGTTWVYTIVIVVLYQKMIFKIMLTRLKNRPYNGFIDLYQGTPC
jgi:hypothetical protein